MFMDAVRDAAEAMRYDSERVANFYDWANKNKVSTDELIEKFEYFMEKK